jgi:hypothetical protein
MRTTITMAATAVLLGAVSTASATLRYQTGFEPSEGYATGNLIGQQAWEQQDGAPPNVDSLVQNSIVRPTVGGLQAVQLKANGPAGNPNADFTDVWTLSSGVTPAQIVAEPLVTIQWDMMRGTLGTGQTETRLWGIDILDAGANHIAATIGAYDDDLGPAIAATNFAGSFVFLGDGSPRGTWDTYTVTINYLTRQYTVALNGTVLGQPQVLVTTANNGISDIDFLALTRGTDSGYFDNLSVTTSPIPEPAALALMPAALALLGRRRSYRS